MAGLGAERRAELLGRFETRLPVYEAYEDALVLSLQARGFDLVRRRDASPAAVVVPSPMLAAAGQPAVLSNTGSRGASFNFQSA
jgi:hypothetical protein